MTKAVFDRVSELTNVPPEVLRHVGGMRHESASRHLIMYILNQRGYSLNEIQQQFNHASHTPIKYGIAMAKKRITDSSYWQELARLAIAV